MTEKSASDVLRELLDERGIEWRAGLENVTWVGDWCFVEYENGKFAATCEPVLTPEQAIAATLGYELNPDGLPVGLTISDDGNLLNWRGENYVKQRGNTLTAEQVMVIAGRHQPDYCSDTHVCFDWQAIADELNAELGADGGSPWHELFGTPERAARTLADNCPGGSCGGCPGIKAETCGLGDYDTLLEWLRGKAVKR